MLKKKKELDRRIEKSTYYIDDISNVSDGFKAKCNNTGIIPIAPSKLADIDQSTIEAVIILCEIEVNEKGEERAIGDHYGIDIAQDLRRKKFAGNILFISFFSRKQLVTLSLKNEIVNAIGHSFLRLPASPKKWKAALEKTAPLDELSLYDIILNYSSIEGLIQNRLHSLSGYVQDDYQQQHEDLIRKVHQVFNLSPTSALNDYKTQLEKSETPEVALQFVDNQCRQLLVKYGADLPGAKNLNKPDYDWEVLWLDDEVGQLIKEKKEPTFITYFKERGIVINVADTYELAMSLWQEDRAKLCKIKVIISDYRLEQKDEDGVFIHNPKQGYHFLKDVAAQLADVALVAYSALPRKFLIESFKHYGIKISIYSKKDFPINDSKTHRYLADEIILLGDESWLSANMQPIGAAWDSMKDSYYRYQNSLKYRQHEKLASRLAQENLMIYIEQFKNRVDFNEIVLADEFPFLNSNLSAVEKTLDKRIIESIKVRRIIIGIYCFFKEFNILETFKNLDDIKDHIAKLIYFSKSENKNKELKGDNVKAIYTKNAITLSSFPVGLIQEERKWLLYESGLNYNIDPGLNEHWRYMSRIQTIIGEAFSKRGFLKKMLKKKYLVIKRNEVDRKLTLDWAKGVDYNRFYFNDSDKKLNVKSVADVKLILNFAYKKINTSDLDYTQKITDFVKLLLNVLDVLVVDIDNKLPPVFSALRTFTKRIPAKTKDKNRVKKLSRNESIIEEYHRLHAPWELIYPKKIGSNEEYIAVCKERKRNCINACKDIAKVKSSWKLYKNIHGSYNELLRKAKKEDDEALMLRAIYLGIYSWKEVRNNIIKSENEKSKDKLVAFKREPSKNNEVESDTLDATTRDQIDTDYDEDAFILTANLDNFNLIFNVDDLNEIMRKQIKQRFNLLMKSFKAIPHRSTRVIFINLDTSKGISDISRVINLDKLKSDKLIAMVMFDNIEDYDVDKAFFDQNLSLIEGQYVFSI